MSGSNLKITVTENSLTFEEKGAPLMAQKVYIKPSEDYGEVSVARSKSNVENYLKVLREKNLTISRGEMSYTFKYGEGDNYSNGFHIKVNEDQKPIKLTNGEGVLAFTISYTGSDPIRIAFEAY